MIICDTLMGKGVPFLERARRTTSSASSRTNGSRRWQHSTPGGPVMKSAPARRHAAPESRG